jgi:hypothetical protein
MKNFLTKIGFIFGAILTLGAIVACGLLAKNLSEFFDREDNR